MKLTIFLLCVVGIVVFLVACKKRGIEADVNASITEGRFQFIALMDPDGRFTYPQVSGVPDWYFQTTGISIRQTKPETKEEDLAYMKEYNATLEKQLKAQGKFHILEENIARVKANLEKQKQ